jgi:hypothetical protein
MRINLFKKKTESYSSEATLGNSLEQKKRMAVTEVPPSPSKMKPDEVINFTRLEGKNRDGKSAMALKVYHAMDDIMNPKSDNSGKKSMLITLKNFIADVKMKEQCVGCEYNHHFLTKEQRDSFNEVMRRISLEHESSSKKKLFREYKTFEDVDTICLAKNCPYGFFHGEKK